MRQYNETIEENPLSAKHLASSIYGWSTLDMLSKGARDGFYLPGTVGIGQQTAKAFGKETSMKFGANVGWKASRIGKMGIARSIKNMGKTSIMSSTGRTLAKNIVGKVAGLGIRAVNWQFGLVLGGEAIGAWNRHIKASQQKRSMNFGNTFVETQGSLTSRQRTARAITGSRLQARSAIGNEAMLMHR